MDRSATQHAGIAAESINGINQDIRAALAHSDDADLARLKDAYEVTASLKLLVQRLTLTASEMKKLVGEWHQEGHLLTAPAVDTDSTVHDFNTAMTAASNTARALFIALDDATKSLAHIGWQEPSAAQHKADS